MHAMRGTLVVGDFGGFGGGENGKDAVELLQ